MNQFLSVPSKLIRVDGFLPDGGKNVFSVVKTGLAKTVFASKNRFLPEYIFIRIKFINFCLYLIE